MSEPHYRILASGPSRPFEISGGLMEGYTSSGYEPPLRDVVDLHHAWESREGVILGLRVQPCDVSYGYPASDGVIIGAWETGFILSGGINVLYDAETTNLAALNRVLSLAAFLAERLHQTRIYVSVGGKDYICERVEGGADNG